MGVDLPTIINHEAWERQALLALHDDAPMVSSRVEWTQYPGHGPGIELFGDLAGRSAVELGCGSGDNLAPLVLAGAHCVGVDLPGAQIHRARTRWGHLPTHFVCAEARAFLSTDRTEWDVCFSIFGAVGFCPPEGLLPLIAERLRPGGRLLFSVPDPRWLGQRLNQMELSDGSVVQVARWLFSPGGWRAAVHAAGLRTTNITEVPAPEGGGPSCIIVTATRAW